MNNFFDESISLMKEIYGKDTPMSFATVNENCPNIRVVDTYYKDNAFYIVTYALSNKVKEITKNPKVALNHNLFVAHGTAENIGHPLEEQNKEIRKELKNIFMPWYNKHNNEQDKNMCFVKITLNDVMLFANDHKYYIDYHEGTATKEKFITDISF